MTSPVQRTLRNNRLALRLGAIAGPVTRPFSDSTTSSTRASTTSPTRTSTRTEAYTSGNITVTGGAGAGATNVYLNPAPAFGRTSARQAGQRQRQGFAEFIAGAAFSPVQVQAKRNRIANQINQRQAPVHAFFSGLSSVVAAGAKEENPGQVVQFPLSSALPDAPQILRIMNSQADKYGRVPLVRETAVRALQAAGVGNNDSVTQLQVLLQFVQSNMVYVRDPEGSEYLVSPLRLLGDILAGRQAYGDCDDHVLLLNSLLNSVGIPARACGIKIGGSPVFNHVITQALIEGAYVDADPCDKQGQMDYSNAEHLV